MKSTCRTTGSWGRSSLRLAAMAEIRSEADDLALSIYAENKIGRDPLYEIAKNYYDAETRSSEEIVREVVGILYRVGAIGTKLRNSDRFLYSHADQPLLPLPQLTEDARVRIHPMLWGAYHMH